MKKKFLLVISLVLVLLFIFCGCTANVRLADIYVNHAELTKFDGAKEEGRFPAEYKIAFGNKNFSNPFFSTHSWVIIQKGTNTKSLRVYDYKNQKWVLGDNSTSFSEIKKSENFIAVKESTASDVSIYYTKTMTKVDMSDISSVEWQNVSISEKYDDYLLYDTGSSVKVYSADLGYITSIYDLGYSVIYDDYIVNCNKEQDASKVGIYKIPNKTDKPGTITKPLEEFQADHVYASYLGNDKFYVFLETRDSNGQYTYQSTKYSGKAKIYNAKTDTIERDFTDTKYYKKIVTKDNEKEENKYGDLTLSLDQILKEGYSFAMEGISIVKGVATEDQFILDKDGEVMISLSGRYGKDIGINDNREGGFSPLFLLFINGKGFSPNLQNGTIRILNIDGTTAFEKNDSVYSNLFYNNDALVCMKYVTELSNKWGPNRYGAYDKKGKRLIDFNYDYMSPFISGYALAFNYVLKNDTSVRVADYYVEYDESQKANIWHKPDGTPLPKDEKPPTMKFGNSDVSQKLYRVDKYGNQTPIEDIAWTKNKIPIFKLGAYVSKNADGTYNVKNFSGEKIFAENFTDIIIDKPNLDDVQICGTRNNQIIIYTLTSSTRGLPKAYTIKDIIIPLVIVGVLSVTAVVIIAVIKNKEKASVAVLSTNAPTKNNVERKRGKKANRAKKEAKSLDISKDTNKTDKTEKEDKSADKTKDIADNDKK